MSLARAHRARHAALALAGASGSEDGAAGASPPDAPAVSTPQAEIKLRLTHDLRRLGELRSIDAKIAAKREMLPAYIDWVRGVVEAIRTAGGPVGDDVLPTIMVWLIDTGDYSSALQLGELVLAHGIPLPARYVRDAATLIVEEIADAALKPGAEGGVPLEVLDNVEALVEGRDLHDQVRAKLHKAIGQEVQRLADAAAADTDTTLQRRRALAALREALRLDERSGVKGRIVALEKSLATAAAAPPPQDQAG